MKRTLFTLTFAAGLLGAGLWFSPRAPAPLPPAIETSRGTASVGVSSVATAAPAAALPAEETDRFALWVPRYAASPMPALEAEGVALAKAREPVMRRLIAADPERALALAVTPRLRAALPAAVLAHVEREVAGVGEYAVLAICNHAAGADHGADRIERSVTLAGERFTAHVHGEGWKRLSQNQASIYGVAIGSDLALHSGDVKVFPASDIPDVAPESPGVMVIYKGDWHWLNDAGQLAAYEKSLVPPPPELPLAPSGPTFDPAVPPTGPVPPTIAYNEYAGDYAHQKGPKTVFVFLIEPSDGPAWTSPPSLAAFSAQLDSASQNYYNASYRQTWFGPKYKNLGAGNEVLVPRLVVSPVVRLSKTTSALLNDISTQANDAKALVEAMGGVWTNNGANDPDNFDRWVVMSNTQLITSTGLAYVGGSISWSGGSLSGSVAEHEFGHNWGVFHANSWNLPPGALPRAPSGSNGEYGDGWDIMGGSGMTQAFNTLFREQLGFLERSRGEVLDVTASGSYRLYNYIDPYARNVTANVRALLLPMSSFTDSKRVFLGFGHLPGTDGGTTRTDWNRNALTVHSGLSGGSNRIDTTPYSQQTGDGDDGSVKIGRTYTEGPNVNGTQINGGFSVTPILRGSTVVSGNTHQWMDVVVNYGAASANPPVASFAQTTFAATTGTPLALAVSASDPDGDALAYDWDFGDGTYSITNSATQNKTWTSAGFYLVTCTVSDMKGRTASATCWVNVGAVAFRTPDNPASTLAALYYRYYEGAFSTMPVFTTLLPVKSGTVATFDLSPRNRNDNFAFQFEGFIDVPASDIYTFKVTSDDGARLYLGSTLVVDNNAVQSSAFSKTGNIALNAGKHKIRVEYFHKDGAETLAIAWGTRTSPLANISAASLSQTDPNTNAAPVVAITQPVTGTGFLVNSDILLQASASDADGIASVVFFADGSYLGTVTAPPFSYSWPKVSVGLRSVIALAYDSTGRWTQSAPVSINVTSPPPQPAIGLNLNGGTVGNGTMYFNDVSGAVYPQANWNNLNGISGSAPNMKDYLGNPTAMSVAWSSTANDNFIDGSSNADASTAPGRMFKGLVEIRHDESNRPTVTATNVPYPQYDIYVYFDLRGTDARDTTPQRFVCTPTEGAAPADIFGKNSMLSTDALGDYPTYDTWVGFKESTATTATASNDALLGNYVVFRGGRSAGFSVKAERQNAGGQQRLGLNAVQIVRSDPTGPVVFIRQTGGSTAVTEGGAGDSYTVALGYAPDSNVTVAVNSGAQLTASPSSLTFTPENWSAPQAVNVSAVNDAAPEAAHTGTITHTVTATGNYNGVTAVALTIAITDDDQPTVAVRAIGNPAEAASPTAATFQFTRGGVGSLAVAMTASFQMSGTAGLSTDYVLSGASVSYNSTTGAGTVVIPAGQAQSFLILTPTNDAVTESSETAILTLTASAGYVIGSPGAATLNIIDDDIADYFTELFETAAAFDLNGRSVTLTPSAGNYIAATTTVSAFPSGTTGFTNFNNSAMAGGSSDDGWWNQTLAVAFPFFGTNRTTAHVGTNGFITFVSGDGSLDSSLASHFSLGRPRISGLFRDLDPGAGGIVSYKRDTTAGQLRSVFFWNAVRNFNLTTTVTFQIELFDDGRIRLTWLSTTPAGACVAGLNSGVAATMPSSPFDGTGVRPFFESNLSGYGGGVGGANSPPQFASIPPTLATVGQSLSYAVACTDLENNGLTLTAPTMPSWLTLTNNGNGTATLSGTPVVSATNPVVLQVTDGTTAVQQVFSIAVVPAGGNTAPQFTSTPVTQTSAGAAYSYAVTANDADGHTLAISSTELPAWLTLTDAGNGTATLSGTAPDTGVQSHPVTLTVSDGLSAAAQSFTLSLNRAPVIVLVSPASGFTELPDRSVTLRLDAVITDDALPAGSTVTAAWSLISGPGAVTFGTPGAPSTTAKFSTPGFHLVRLTTSDGAATATRDVNVFVESDGDAVAANGQQGWWKFDEGTGATAADSSGNARPLTLTSATMTADGYAGKAYTGNATPDHYAENTTLSCPALVTLSAWVYATATPSSSDRYIFNFHTGSNPRLGLFMASGTSRLRLLSDRTTDGLWEAQYNVPAFEWFHVAVTYDTSSAAATPVFYINGRVVASSVIGPAASGTQVSSSALRIGGNYNNSWLGRLDEARVHNRLVPATEIPLLALPNNMNAAPIATAGPDGDTATGVAFTLAGTATDDGTPAPLALQWTKISGPAGVTFGSDSAAATTATFAAAGTYVLRLTADDTAVRVFDEVTVTAVGQTFASWLAGYPALTGASALTTADPDGDGVNNLVEYALGGDPTSAASAPTPTVGTSTSGGTFLTLTFLRARLELTYVVQGSTDLVTWPDLSTNPGSVSLVTPVTFTDSVNLPTANPPRRFLRLKVTSP